MSSKLFPMDTLFLQRVLMISGFYRGPLDGKWSDGVDAGEKAFLARFEQLKTQLGAFDDRTESNIRTLIPAAQAKAREFMVAARRFPLTCKIISGTRTYAEQDDLYRIGRTVQRDRRPVTKARGGQSNHNFAVAWDVGIFDNGKYYTGDTRTENKAYVDLAALITTNVPGLEWGGNWKSFPDKPHYQLATNMTEAQLRGLFEQGKAFA